MENTALVHNIETTAFEKFPANYQEYRKRNCSPEFERTKSIYQLVDSAEGSSRAEKLLSCRHIAWFARAISDGTVKVISSSCRQRWCPICSQAKSFQIREQVKNWLASVSAPKLCTFTMKHTTAPLAHQITWLYKHFRLFRQRKKIKPYIQGGIWFFQLKKSSTDNLWHPHLHCLLDSKFIPHSVLSSEWFKQTLTSDVVDIRVIRDPDDVADYVARYCARPAKLTDFTVKEGVEIVTVFHGRRLCGSWGTGKNAELSKKFVAEKSDYEKIGNWSLVVKRARFSIVARAILKAFKTGSVIPRGICIVQDPDSDEVWTGREPPDIGIEDCNFNWRSFK